MMLPSDAVQRHADAALHAHDFFLARQPILDAVQGLVAYELLFRRTAAGPADVTDDLLATASVMANVAALGMSNVVGEARAFLNVDVAVLMGDFMRFLPQDKVVFEILETVSVTPALTARVAQLAAAGWKFALDDVVAASDTVLQLLPYVEIVKIEVRGMAPAALAQLVLQLKQSGKKLLAEKVETPAEFAHCLALGFDYFQGYYFASPMILSGKKLTPSQHVIMQLLALIGRGADHVAIEQLVKQDVSLGLTLLRMVNTPLAGAPQRIDSLGDAVALLGQAQLERWLQILLYAEPRKSPRSVPALLVLATTRGKLLELIAQQQHPDRPDLAEKAFTVGILSLMDVLFGQPMAAILAHMPVAEEVREALLHRGGQFGDMLMLAEAIEHIEQAGPLLPHTLQRLGLSIEALNAAQLAAFEWSNSITANACRNATMNT